MITANAEGPVKEPGWWNPKPLAANSKWHFVRQDGATLCGRWLFLRGTIEHGNDGSADNCRQCKNRLAKLQQEKQREQQQRTAATKN